MAQTRSAKRVLGGRAAACRQSIGVALSSALAALLCGPLAGGAAAAPAPTSLRITPEVNALSVHWRVDGGTEGLRGFRVRWQPLYGGPSSWSKPVERPVWARSYRITHLAHEPYKVRVRSVLADGTLGGWAVGVGTPLRPTKVEEPPKEEPPKEEPPKEEPPKEEPPKEEHEEGVEGSGAVLAKAPAGPPTPASGWHIVYGDAFGAPLGAGAGQDNTLQSGEKSRGCCNNSNEIAVEQHAQARVGAHGLELICSEGSFTVEGVTRKYSCGGVRGDAFVEWNYATSGEWVAECVCRWPANTGAADPGWWVFTGAQEIDFFEGWGWNGTSWLSANAGMPVVVGQHEFELNLVSLVLGFEPAAAYHRYTTAFIPVAGSTFLVVEYIDGIERWSFDANLADTSDGPILTNALRQPADAGHASASVLSARSIAIYQDGAHAGVGVRGGGIAPGTTVAR